MRYILFPIILLSCISCNFVDEIFEEKFLQCDSNCYEVKFSGRIINAVTNKGMSDIKVQMYWDKVIDWSISDDIDTAYSNKEGYFYLENFVDTSYFSNYYFIVIALAVSEKDYIGYPDDLWYSIDYTSECLNNGLNFVLYPRAELEIKFIRTEKDTFDSFTFEYKYGSDPRNKHSFDLDLNNLQSNQLFVDNILLDTSADIYTDLKWIKRSGTNEIIKTDKIICKKNKSNVFKIYY